MKNIYIILLGLLTSCITCSCSGDNDNSNNGNESDNEKGELTINGKRYIGKANTFVGTDITSSAIDDVEEEPHSITFMKYVYLEGGSLIPDYEVFFELARINFETVKGGDELQVKSALVYSVLGETLIDYLEGTYVSGSVIFESLSADQTLVRLSFSNVKIEVYNKEKGKTSNYTIDGTMAYRRNDIMTKPDYPYSNLTINSQTYKAAPSGTWFINQYPYEDVLMLAGWKFQDEQTGADKYFHILMGTEYGDNFKPYLNGMVGVNIGTSEYSVVSSYASYYMTYDYNCYVSGVAKIIEINKPDYLFMYPDIIFKFENLVIKLNGKEYTINGESKAVYKYAKAV